MKNDSIKSVSIESGYIDLAVNEFRATREQYRAARERDNAFAERCEFSSAEAMRARESRIAFQNRLFGIKTTLYFLGIIDSEEYCAD